MPSNCSLVRVAETVTLRLIPRRKKKVCAPQVHWDICALAVPHTGGKGCAVRHQALFRPQAVKWAGDVVDNEFMNKKSSKSALAVLCLLQHCLAHYFSAHMDTTCVLLAECCIFHKQQEFGEWSDDDAEGPCKEAGGCG